MNKLVVWLFIRSSNCKGLHFWNLLTILSIHKSWILIQYQLNLSYVKITLNLLKNKILWKLLTWITWCLFVTCIAYKTQTFVWAYKRSEFDKKIRLFLVSRNIIIDNWFTYWKCACMCVYPHTYICTYVCMYVCMYVRMYQCVCMHATKYSIFCMLQTL